MMEPMHDDPASRRLLKIAHPKNGQKMFEPQRTLIATMSEQTMITGSNSHRAKYVIADRQPKQTPPAKEIRQKSQRNQAVKKSHSNDVGPDDPALAIDQRRAPQLRQLPAREKWFVRRNLLTARVTQCRRRRAVCRQWFNIRFDAGHRHLQVRRESR